jgi:hypothetical protein
VLASCNWIRALYDHSNSSFRADDHRIVTSLILKAIKSLSDPDSWSVASIDNLCPVSRVFLRYCSATSYTCTQSIRDTFDLQTPCGLFSHISQFLLQCDASARRRSLKHPLSECIFVRVNKITCRCLQC